MEKIKDMNYWSRKQFLALPKRRWNQDCGTFSSLVLLPLHRVHDSGYRILDFIGVKGKLPIVRLSGCSDVIEFNGTGGHGLEIENIRRDYIPGFPYRIDCLRVSGLFRLWVSGYELQVDPALSSFSFYPVKV